MIFNRIIEEMQENKDMIANSKTYQSLSPREKKLYEDEIFTENTESPYFLPF